MKNEIIELITDRIKSEHEKHSAIDWEQIAAAKIYSLIKDVEPKILYDFFMWFRENGEKHLDKSIEKMIDEYINK